MSLERKDFTRLRSDTKFGDCGGYAFSPAKTSIMKAIMSLVSKDVWPEISYDSFDVYLDENGKPKSMFYGVWSDQKGLKREQYVEAVEQYFNVCEPIITRRSEKIVQKLKEVISLDSIIIPEEDTIVLQVPEQFTKLKSLPEDPENAVSYGKDSKDALRISISRVVQEAMKNGTIPYQCKQENRSRNVLTADG